MEQNPNPNFLNSASNYWSSKFKFIQKPVAAQQEIVNSVVQNLPVRTQIMSPINQPFYYQNVYTKPQIIPQTMNQPQYFVQNNATYPPSIGMFQNLVPNTATGVPQIYNNNQTKLMPSVETQNNYYQPASPNFFPYANQNENMFGAVLNKAGNFWYGTAPYSQNQILQRPQYYYSQGFHSNPISREFSSSNNESDPFSLEGGSVNKGIADISKIQKKIKKNYKRKTKTNSKKNYTNKTNDAVSIAKKLLAIANNWQEVCKKIPENLQLTFKEKMKRYLKRRILPDLQLKNKLQRAEMREPSSELEIGTNEMEDEFKEVKFDEIFGKDLEKLFKKNEENSTAKDSMRRGWQPPAFNQNFESPTLSKILKQDALSINFEIKEKEGFINENEEKNLYFETNIERNEEEINLVDMMINEKKEQEELTNEFNE